MIRMKATIPDLPTLRMLPQRSRNAMRTELQTIVKPVVQAKVDELYGTAPGKVQYPFEFGTDKSRRAFFATNGFGRGLPTPRSNQLPTSWVVEFSSQFIADALRIYNNKSYAQFVYGSPLQRQIPGHRRTGWQLYNDPAKIKAILDTAKTAITQSWVKVVLNVLHT